MKGDLAKTKYGWGKLTGGNVLKMDGGGGVKSLGHYGKGIYREAVGLAESQNVF